MVHKDFMEIEFVFFTEVAWGDRMVLETILALSLYHLLAVSEPQ